MVSMNERVFSRDIDGSPMTATISDLAMHADGSVLLSYRGTVILATVVPGEEKPDSDFFPLTVDFEERFYASGKILGSQFTRREGKPSDKAILTGRIVDRTIRPLFDPALRREVQVVLTLIALSEGDVEMISVIAASIALSISSIPWGGPVSSVSHRDGFDLLICGKNGLVTMIEASGNEIEERLMFSIIKKSLSQIDTVQKFQEEIIRAIGKEKWVIERKKPSPVLVALFDTEIAPDMKNALFSKNSKENNEKLLEKFIKLVRERLSEEDIVIARNVFDERAREIVHDEAIDNKNRVDGRALEELRPISVRAGGISPVLHGSGTFYRGETHILSVLTLGGSDDAQTIDDLSGTKHKRYIHHYNFPPFSTGETGRVGTPNRRMIGHGALAEKALLPVIPDEKTFPYTIRVVSEAFSSNGSTSMGSVCGSTIALMDGGVPISAPVAGISIGLMLRERRGMLGSRAYEYSLLTDIQGFEDHYGDMDFKVAGTRTGITAIQLDVKVPGITLAMVDDSLGVARKARISIIDKIESVIPKPRANLYSSAPKIATITIPGNAVGVIIGPGGKTIREIEEKTGAFVSIGDNGIVTMTGTDEAVKKAGAVIAKLSGKNDRI